MARSKTKSKTTRRRDTFDIANRRLPPDVDLNDDLRQYHPARFTPFTVSGKPSSVMLDSVSTTRPRARRVSTVGYEGTTVSRTKFRSVTPFKTLQTLSAAEPVALCVRRARRQEVLFAKNKAGRKGQRRPRWTQLSKLKCKR